MATPSESETAKQAAAAIERLAVRLKEAERRAQRMAQTDLSKGLGPEKVRRKS
jgi:hypothetical protein